MPSSSSLPPLIDWAQLAHETSQTILSIGPEKIVHKSDGSPVTAADLAANEVIVSALSRWTPDIPILSEESPHDDYATRQNWKRFWCVDPLDGTQSFINGNSDFCINIGLVDNGEPVFGVLALPKKGLLFIGGPATGKTWRGELGADSDFEPIVPPERQTDAPLIIATSRHSGPTMERYLNLLTQSDGLTPCTRPASGAIKFSFLLTGEAHHYPRFQPSMWWDTVAGHALVLTHGYDIYPVDNPDTSDFNLTSPLRYDGENLTNTAFVCQPCG